MKKDELYASLNFEMLKALVEKIALRCNRKNLSSIEKIKVLQEPLYQVYETDTLKIIHPLRYQRTETRLNLSHQFPSQLKDAVRKFVNAMLKIFKEGFDLRKDFLKPPLQPAYDIVSWGIKKG